MLEEIDVDRDLFNISLTEQLKSLIGRYAEVFSKGSGDLGRTAKIQHKIETGDAVPIRLAPRRVPLHKKEEVKIHIEDMLRGDVIKPSYSPWSSPVVMVPKKDGTTRFCVDYRKMNAVTKKDAYPLPRIDDTLDSLAGATLFSTLDLASGYWQVEVAPQDREKTAFSTPFGLYEFKVMPFGLCGAPGTFQRLMEAVLEGLQWEICLIYLDDIIIFSRSFDEHLQRLETVLQRLRDANLKVKPKKCHLFQKRLMFRTYYIQGRYRDRPK